MKNILLDMVNICMSMNDSKVLVSYNQYSHLLYLKLFLWFYNFLKLTAITGGMVQGVLG